MFNKRKQQVQEQLSDAERANKEREEEEAKRIKEKEERQLAVLEGHYECMKTFKNIA